MTVYDSYILIACERADLGAIRQAVHALAVDSGDLPFRLSSGVPPHTTAREYGADYKALKEIYERNMGNAKNRAKSKLGYIVTCHQCSRRAMTTSKFGMMGLTKFIARIGWLRRGTHVVCQRCADPRTDDILSTFDSYTRSAVKRSHGGAFVIEEMK